MIPYNDREQLEKTSVQDERYNSAMVKVLSGNRVFKYYKSEKNCPTHFTAAASAPNISAEQ